MVMITKTVKRPRKPGRPRAISEDMEPIVVDLYSCGYGYRAITRILNSDEFGINVHFSSIRKTLIRLGKVEGK
jgi:hypothetical protein